MLFNKLKANFDSLEIVKQIKLAIFKYKKLLIAFSGGMDSTILLDILNKIKIKSKKSLFTFRAIHINHNLNYKSNYWSNQCIKHCNKINVSCKIIKFDKNYFTRKTNIEGKFREKRYKILFNELENNECLVTAHHMNDQLETFLLALKRGSGPKGLSGMSSNCIKNKHRILRPMINCQYNLLQEYAKIFNLKWIEDPSNKNIYFDRNFLRIKIIPLIQNRWPYFIKSVYRSAILCSEQEKLIDELLKNKIKKIITSKKTLKLKFLIKKSILQQKSIIRYWLNILNINMPSMIQLDKIYHEIIFSKKKLNPKIILGNNIITKYHEELYAVPRNFFNIIKKKIYLCNKNINEIKLNNNLGKIKFKKIKNKICKFKEFKNCKSIIRIPNINEKIYIKFGYIQDLISIKNRYNGKKLKVMLKELFIPPWLRDKIPLLFYNKTLISIINIFVTDKGKIDINSDYYWKIIWKDSIYKI